MTQSANLAIQLRTAQRYFTVTASAFDENDSGFAPTPEMFTVAAQIAHTADTVAWFVEGAFGDGWDLDFEAFDARARGVTSIAAALASLEQAFDAAAAAIEGASDEELAAPIPDERMMKGMPRRGIVNGIVDHTAHHRGSLAVYARVAGRTPVMPYTG